MPTKRFKASTLQYENEELMKFARYSPVTVELDNYTKPEYLMISTFVEPFTNELLYICRYARPTAICNKYEDYIGLSYDDALSWLDQF